MPATRNVYAWAAKDLAFQRRLQLARDDGEESIREGYFDLIDSPTATAVAEAPAASVSRGRAAVMVGLERASAFTEGEARARLYTAAALGNGVLVQIHPPCRAS